MRSSNPLAPPRHWPPARTQNVKERDTRSPSSRPPTPHLAGNGGVLVGRSQELWNLVDQALNSPQLRDKVQTSSSLWASVPCLRMILRTPARTSGTEAARGPDLLPCAAPGAELSSVLVHKASPTLVQTHPTRREHSLGCPLGPTDLLLLIKLLNISPTPSISAIIVTTTISINHQRHHHLHQPPITTTINLNHHHHLHHSASTSPIPTVPTPVPTVTTIITTITIIYINLLPPPTISSSNQQLHHHHLHQLPQH